MMKKLALKIYWWLKERYVRQLIKKLLHQLTGELYDIVLEAVKEAEANPHATSAWKFDKAMTTIKDELKRRKVYLPSHIIHLAVECAVALIHEELGIKH